MNRRPQRPGRNRLRSRFIADQRAAVVDTYGRLLREQVSRGAGDLLSHTHPVARGMEHRLRLWLGEGLTRYCGHVDILGAPAPTFWLLRRPDTVRCADCLLEVLDPPAGQERRCDVCTACGSMDTAGPDGSGA